MDLRVFESIATSLLDGDATNDDVRHELGTMPD